MQNNWWNFSSFCQRVDLADFKMVCLNEKFRKKNKENFKEISKIFNVQINLI